MEKTIVSNNLAESLNEQLAAEKLNANKYLFIGGDLRNRGFDKLAEFFEKQHEEETAHSLMIYKLLTDLNVPVKLLEINEVKIPINYITDISAAFLEAEIATTESLVEIKKQAAEEDCGIVEEKMREMIMNQEAEMEEAYTFNDHATLCGNDWYKVMLWNSTLKE